MTDTTDLGEIIVTGQRRSGSSSPFPSIPSTISIPAPYTTPEVRKGDLVEVAPCDYGPFRQRWDADAAAMAAVDAFLEAAENFGGNDVGPSGPDLANREFGAVVRRFPRGRVELGPITWGGPQGSTNGSTVVFDETGASGYNIVGFIHNHPSGGSTPSPMGPDGSGDWGVFEYFADKLEAVGRSRSELTMYLVVAVVSGGKTTYKVLAFDADATGPNAGKEVNPNAQPCPA